MNYGHLYPPRTDLPTAAQADIYCTTEIMEHMRSMVSVEVLRRKQIKQYEEQLQQYNCCGQTDDNEPIVGNAEAEQVPEEVHEYSESSMSLKGRPGSDDSSTEYDDMQDDL